MWAPVGGCDPCGHPNCIRSHRLWVKRGFKQTVLPPLVCILWPKGSSVPRQSFSYLKITWLCVSHMPCLVSCADLEQKGSGDGDHNLHRLLTQPPSGGPYQSLSPDTQHFLVRENTNAWMNICCPGISECPFRKCLNGMEKQYIRESLPSAFQIVLIGIYNTCICICSLEMESYHYHHNHISTSSPSYTSYSTSSYSSPRQLPQSTTTSSSASSQKVLSCAECRRSKLRCDRVFPCETCRKRGLEHLCPNEALVTRPKSLAADAEYLRVENIRLQERVRQLEVLLAGFLQGGQPQVDHIMQNLSQYGL